MCHNCNIFPTNANFVCPVCKPSVSDKSEQKNLFVSSVKTDDFKRNQEDDSFEFDTCF
jgi:hypothetical protein